MKGQSLVEAIIALAVVVGLAVALVSASLVTQRSSRAARNNTQATKLAGENIEQLRVLRDRRGFDYLSNTSCAVLNAPSGVEPKDWTLSACPGPPTNGEQFTLSGTTFTRSIVITTPAVGKKKQVVVNVEWTDSVGVQKVTNTTFLSNCVTTATSC